VKCRLLCRIRRAFKVGVDEFDFVVDAHGRKNPSRDGIKKRFGDLPIVSIIDQPRVNCLDRHPNRA